MGGGLEWPARRRSRRPPPASSMIHLRTHGPDETLRLGERIGGRLPAGSVVGLDGELGTGKTWMAKGLVRGIGEFDPALVKSPAYNLVHEYPVVRGGETVPVVHIDFYRLAELSPTDRLLFEEYFGHEDRIVIVEWAGKFLVELAPGYLSVALSLCGDGGQRSDPDCREVEVATVGDATLYGALLEDLESP